MQIKNIYKNLSYLHCQDSHFTHFWLIISLWHLLVKELFLLGKFVYFTWKWSLSESYQYMGILYTIVKTVTSCIFSCIMLILLVTSLFVNIENDLLDLTCQKHSRWPPYGIPGHFSAISLFLDLSYFQILLQPETFHAS